VPSGYGQTTSRTTPRLKALGHDVAIFANYGLQGDRMEWGGMTVYPQTGEAWGNDVITAFAIHHFTDGGETPDGRNAGWVIFLQDVWTVRSDTIRSLHLAGYAPVDHDPAPPRVIDFFTRTGAVPLSMSKHGHKMFEQAGLKPIYVPHGIDTKQFRPIPEVRDTVRAALGIPQDAFVYGMVAANQASSEISRKSFPSVFQAFKKIHERHPDTFLYLHTLQTKMTGGFDLKHLAEEIGLEEDSYTFVDQFGYVLGEIHTDDMPGIYSAIDTLVNPALGEGFGMPIIEAQSCGVPVVLADNTAMHDLCGGGWLVPCERVWDEMQKSWWGGLVSVKDLTTAMEKAFQAGSKPGKQAREFVIANHDEDTIVENNWKPALETLEAMLHAPDAKPIDMDALKI
jgi:glycosyltransferase involved in cell wall biosynthesis